MSANELGKGTSRVYILGYRELDLVLLISPGIRKGSAVLLAGA